MLGTGHPLAEQLSVVLPEKLMVSSLLLRNPETSAPIKHEDFFNTVNYVIPKQSKNWTSHNDNDAVVLLAATMYTYFPCSLLLQSTSIMETLPDGLVHDDPHCVLS